MSPIEMIQVIEAYETWDYEKQYKSAMEELYSANKVETIQGDNVNWLTKALQIISSPTYELVMNIVTLLNIITVFLNALR